MIHSAALVIPIVGLLYIELIGLYLMLIGLYFVQSISMKFPLMKMKIEMEFGNRNYFLIEMEMKFNLK